MKRTLLIILSICVFASWSQAEPEEKKKKENKDRKVIETLNVDPVNLDARVRDAQVQEQIEVAADEFPGLNVSFENPADSLRSYKPYTKQELQAYSDLLLDYKLTDFDRTETARPHKPARLFQVRVPADDDE